MLARSVQSTTPTFAPVSEREQLLCTLVRRYLLLAQTPASEWSRNEAALLMLADSLLGRYDKRNNEINETTLVL
jgi:hypothetical protein